MTSQTNKTPIMVAQEISQRCQQIKAITYDVSETGNTVVRSFLFSHSLLL
jgi:hypothetical protein